MHRFSDILFVATDPGPTPALARAAALARRNGGRLTIARLVDARVGKRVSGSAWGTVGVEGSVGSAYGAELAALAVSAGEGLRVSTRLLWGRSECVIAAVRAGEYDLVVKQAETAEGLRARLFGGIDRGLIRCSPSPVWFFDGARAGPVRSVLAAVDVAEVPASGLGARIVQVGSSLAAREGAAFHVVHAWSVPSEAVLRTRARGAQRVGLRARLRWERRSRLGALARLVAEHTVEGVDAHRHLVKASAPAGIARAAEAVAADVVILGTAGRTGLGGLLIGNTAERLLPGLRGSVLTVASGAAVPGRSGDGRRPEPSRGWRRGGPPGAGPVYDAAFMTRST